MAIVKRKSKNPVLAQFMKLDASSGLQYILESRKEALMPVNN